MAFTDMVKGLLNWHEKYNSDMRSVETQLSNKANVPSSQWYELDLLNGATCERLLRYRKEVNCVYLDGWVESRIYQTIAVLPEGYRPSTVMEFVTTQSSGADTHNTARLVIAPDGTIGFSRSSQGESALIRASACVSFAIG